MTDTTPLFVEPAAAAPVVQAEPAAAAPEPAAAAAVAAVPDLSAYTFVRMPDGSVAAVPNADVVNATESPATVASEAPKAGAAAVAPEPHYYVWLADGTTRRVKESDLPPVAGTNAPYGVWQESGKVFIVAGVYPVESETK